MKQRLILQNRGKINQYGYSIFPCHPLGRDGWTVSFLTINSYGKIDDEYFHKDTGRLGQEFHTELELIRI